MITAVYKSRRKTDTYVYVIKQEDEATNLDVVPESVRTPLGQLDYVMDIDLSTRDKLARVDIEALKRALDENGLYIQMPPTQEELTRLDETLSRL
ncbi:MAG: YcgL domain-containing protein [Gammaproteobacteria bacterium]|nr:YcgL domain-containing protein [Gammaproteobacteria bacterium]